MPVRSRTDELRTSLKALEETSLKRLNRVFNKFWLVIEDPYEGAVPFPCGLSKTAAAERAKAVETFKAELTELLSATYLASGGIGISLVSSELGPEYEIPLLGQSESAILASLTKDVIKNVNKFVYDLNRQSNRACSGNMQSSERSGDADSFLVRIVVFRLFLGRSKRDLIRRLRASLSVASHKGSAEEQLRIYQALPRRKGKMLRKRWNARADGCILCKNLHGSEISLGEQFRKGKERVYGDLLTPPRHPNCSCNISIVVVNSGD